MKFSVRPELSTASVGSSQAPTAAVDNSAPFATRPKSTYKSGKVVQTSGATSLPKSMRRLLKLFIVAAVIALLGNCKNPSVPNNSSVLETGPETPCKRDSDCRCRIFTGEKFIEGTEQSRCCNKTEPLFCPEVNHCLQCVYD